MIPKQYRLKHDKDFEVLFKEGRFIRGEYVSAKVWRIDTEVYPRRNYTKDTLRIGFVVSKKVEKRAVGRNKIKRRMREAVRVSMKEQEWKRGYLVSFMAGPQPVHASYQDIEQDVLNIARCAKLI
jgi:ribonuclease P protein component